jgi:hypothetical protein
VFEKSMQKINSIFVACCTVALRPVQQKNAGESSIETSMTFYLKATYKYNNFHILEISAP